MRWRRDSGCATSRPIELRGELSAALRLRLELGHRPLQLWTKAARHAEESRTRIRLVQSVLKVKRRGGNRLRRRVMEGGEVGMAERLLDSAALRRIPIEHPTKQQQCGCAGLQADGGARVSGDVCAGSAVVEVAVVMVLVVCVSTRALVRVFMCAFGVVRDEIGWCGVEGWHRCETNAAGVTTPVGRQSSDPSPRNEANRRCTAGPSLAHDGSARAVECQELR